MCRLTSATTTGACTTLWYRYHGRAQGTPAQATVHVDGYKLPASCQVVVHRLLELLDILAFGSNVGDELALQGWHTSRIKWVCYVPLVLM